MAFSISFTGKPNEYLEDDPSVPSAIGRIIAGELDEEFVSSLYKWNEQDYRSQWMESLRSLLNGANRAVLITWFINAKESTNLQWWALYRGREGVVHVQNHLPWYENFSREFSVAEAERFLHDRITVNEDGLSVSEWDVPIRDIESFVSSQSVSHPD